MASNHSQQVVQKLCNYCNILRDDGLSYDEPRTIPPEYDWQRLLQHDGAELEIHYRHTLEALGKQPGMLGVIFRKAQNKIQDPAKLKRLISDLIDQAQWSSLDADVKGDAYEGLLEK